MFMLDSVCMLLFQNLLSALPYSVSAWLESADAWESCWSSHASPDVCPDAKNRAPVSNQSTLTTAGTSGNPRRVKVIHYFTKDGVWAFITAMNMAFEMFETISNLWFNVSKDLLFTKKTIALPEQQLWDASSNKGHCTLLQQHLIHRVKIELYNVHWV